HSGRNKQQTKVYEEEVGLVFVVVPSFGKHTGQFITDGCRQEEATHHKRRNARRTEFGHQRETNRAEEQLAYGDNAIAGYKPQCRYLNGTVTTGIYRPYHHQAGQCGYKHTPGYFGRCGRLFTSSFKETKECYYQRRKRHYPE